MAEPQVYQSEEHSFILTEIASGLEYPWGMAFLPNGDMLVTEREGALRIIRDGALDPSPVSGLPDNIYVVGQGGLLDVAIHPDFETNGWIYLSYAGSGEGGAGTEVLRGRLDGDALTEVGMIFRVVPKTRGSLHYGSRLAFTQDGKLLITTGDRYNFMEEAQNRDNHLGAVIRLNDDGSVPDDNPFVAQDGYRPEIFTYGHRNVQGLAIRPSDGVIWIHEHGPRGGDEVNILRSGRNYGWPAITYGIDYSGAVISKHTHKERMEQPVIHWTPSIAPSGMAFYDGNVFPEWRGDIFVGALAGNHLRRLTLSGDEVIAQEVMLNGFGRVRDVENGPDGHLYIIVDSLDGQVFRLDPVD